MIDSKAKETPERGDDSPAFVELPTGIFTAEGVWFHTTVKDLHAFAAPVLEKVSLEQLFREAAAWLRSPATLALWVVLAALVTRSPGVASVLGLVAFAGWSVLAPGLIGRPLIRIFQALHHPFVSGMAYVGVLSWLAAGGETWSVAVGLAWFIALRWRVLERVLDPVLRPIRRKLYGLPPADQILRGVIIRHALALRVSVGDLADMERRMMKIANRHRQN